MESGRTCGRLEVTKRHPAPAELSRALTRTRAYVEGQLRGMGESRKAAELKEMVAEKEWRGELGIGLAEWWWC